MKSKTVAVIIITILISIGCIVLNFPVFLMGSYATLKNVIVTFTYLAIWISISMISAITKREGLTEYCRIFWAINLILGIAFYGNSIEPISWMFGWALPLSILFGGQWYGMMYFAKNFVQLSIIITLISSGMFAITYISHKQIIQNKI